MADNGVKVSVRIEWPEGRSSAFVIGRYESEGERPYVRSWSLDNVARVGREDMPTIVRSIIAQLEALLPLG